MEKYFDEWFQWCQKNQMNQKLLHYYLLKLDYRQIIIGFENSKQLQDILKARKIKKQYSFPKIKCKDRKLLDPSNWSKLIK